MIRMGEKLWVICEYLLLIAVPTLLMQDIRVLAYRPLIMGLTIVYISFMSWRKRYTLPALGLRTDNFLLALGHVLPGSILVIIGMSLVAYLLPRTVVVPLLGADGLAFPLLVRLVMYIFASVPVQEMIYRGYLMLRLEVVSASNTGAGVLAAVAFTLGHVPFQSPLMLATAALLSVLYVRAYQRDRNLLALCLSHAMVGASLMLVRNSLVPF